MLMTVYGDLDYKDPESLRDWISAHSLAHRQERQAAILAGVGIQAVILDTPRVDNDWFGRHGLAHYAMRTLYQPNGSVSASMLWSNIGNWGSEQQFYDWHQYHDGIHQMIDQALGLSD